MSVPDFQRLLLPILTYAKDSNVHRNGETFEHIKNAFDLSPDELAERVSNGRTRLMDRTLWAITYLRKAGLLQSAGWGRFQITERGQSLLAEKPSSLRAKDLERYPEFLDFKNKGRLTKTTSSDPEDAGGTPEERLEKTFEDIRGRLETELLDTLKASSPTYFEKIVVLLLVAMGYGGTIEDAGRTTQKVGDDGIDGIIKEDRLGLELIHIQAKRWSYTVGRPEIQNFAGSLEGQRGRKGVFITTSTFSNEARQYVSRIEKKIVLIDGAELARLCVDFNVGVVGQTTYTLKKIDSDFFNEE